MNRSNFKEITKEHIEVCKDILKNNGCIDTDCLGCPFDSNEMCENWNKEETVKSAKQFLELFEKDFEETLKTSVDPAKEETDSTSYAIIGVRDVKQVSKEEFEEVVKKPYKAMEEASEIDWETFKKLREEPDVKENLTTEIDCSECECDHYPEPTDCEKCLNEISDATKKAEELAEKRLVVIKGLFKDIELYKEKIEELTKQISKNKRLEDQIIDLNKKVEELEKHNGILESINKSDSKYMRHYELQMKEYEKAIESLTNIMMGKGY
jgi:hypothetical protein